jgi:regulator of sirC expression with transglutaminase-like and TPR domain
MRGEGAADLALFAQVAARPETELDLARAALLIAEPEYPELDIPKHIATLDQLGEDAERRLVGVAPGVDQAARLLGFLYQELGFHGNSAAYHDPRNSFLNQVLERRTGIPITLALVVLEVARRVGIAADGVCFPGHFLVRAPVSGGLLLIDPFPGRLLTASELQALYTQHTGKNSPPEAELLAPASKVEILLRLLANLRAIYRQANDQARLRSVLERMAILSPDDSEIARACRAAGGSLALRRPTRGVH